MNRRVKSAIAGVAASAVIAAGAAAGETLQHNAERDGKIECISKLDGKEQEDCVSSVEEIYGGDDGYELLEIAGVIGIIGCGYIGYKAIKKDVGETGIIEDYYNR